MIRGQTKTQSTYHNVSLVMAQNAMQQQSPIGTANVELQHSSDSEDEPWDQKQQPLGGSRGGSNEINDRVSLVTSTPTQQPRQQQSMPVKKYIVDDDGDLDDGDLPSLSTGSYKPAAASLSINANDSRSTPRQSSTGYPVTTRPLRAGAYGASETAGAPFVTPSPNGKTERGQRKFRGQTETGAVPVVEKRRRHIGNHVSSSSNVSGYVDEESGPHDEMEARRAASYREKKSLRNKSGSRRRGAQKGRRAGDYGSDSDEASTDYAMSRADTYETESYDGDDRTVETKDDYDHTFCGQTLTAIGEFCGGLATTADSPVKKASDGSKRSTRKDSSGKEDTSKSLSVPQLDNVSTATRNTSTSVQNVTSSLQQGFDDKGAGKTIHHDSSGSILDTSKAPAFDSPALHRRMSEDTQQENTAIEVEFVEPVQSLDRKNALLNAMAKKAKEEFEGNQRKKELLKAEPPAVTSNSKIQSNSSLEQAIPLQRAVSDAKSEVQSVTSNKSEEDIYNSMTAAEKRKFLSYINSGKSPYEATQKVMIERSMRENEPTLEEKRMHNAAKQLMANQKKEVQNAARARVLEKAKVNAKRLAFWKRGSKSNDSDESGKNQKSSAHDSAPLKTADSASNDSQSIVKASDDNKFNAGNVDTNEFRSMDIAQVKSTDTEQSFGSVPFKKSGNSYYDAVRREHEDDYDPIEAARLEFDSFNKIRSGDRSMKLPFPVPLPSKSKGFEELKETDEKLKPQSAAKSYDSDVRFSELETTTTNLRTVRPPEQTQTDADRELMSLENPSHLLAISRPETPPREDIVDVNLNGASSIPDSAPEPSTDRQLASSTEEAMLPPNDEVADVASSDALGLLPNEPYNDNSIGLSNIPPMTNEEGTLSNRRLGQPLPSAFRGEALLTPVTIVENQPFDIEQEDVDTQDAIVTDQLQKNTEEMKSEQNSQDSDQVQPEEVQKDGGLDVSIETYFNATAAISSASKPGARDAMSVYTMGTNFTTGSAYSQSSRARRPGVAKTRLAKQKEAESKLTKKNGWHETIKAAAASTNRAWDPKKGWVDYRDPDVDLAPETSIDTSKDRIRIDLDRSTISARSSEQHEAARFANVEPGVCIPFPSAWERDRLAMLDSTHGNDSANDDAGYILNDRSEKNLQEPFVGVTPKGMVSVAASTTSGSDKPKGWVESMKAASAALANTGVKWDPINGWTSTNTSTQHSGDSTAVDVDDVLIQAPLSGEEDVRYSLVAQPGAGVETRSLSPRLQSSPIYEARPSQQTTLLNRSVQERSEQSVDHSNQAYVDSATHLAKEDSQYNSLGNASATRTTSLVKENMQHDSRSLPASTPTNKTVVSARQVDSRLHDGDEDDDTKRNVYMPSKPMASHMIEEKEGFAMVHVAAAESSNVSEQAMFGVHDRGADSHGVDQNATRDDADGISLSARDGVIGGRLMREKSSNTFTSEDDVRPSSTVNVVKEKVGEEALELFGNPNDADHVNHRISMSPKEDRSRSVISAESSKDSSYRRGAGPIDVDEVDETWDSDDDKRHSKRYEERSMQDSSINLGNGVVINRKEEDHIKGWKSRDPSPPAYTCVDNISIPRKGADRSRFVDKGNERVDDAANRTANYAGDARSAVSSSTRGSARSSLSKRVPRLERSRRDTSPIASSRLNAERESKAKLSSPSPIVSPSDDMFGGSGQHVVDGMRDEGHHSDSGLTMPVKLVVGMGGVEEGKNLTDHDYDPAEDKYTYSPEDNRRRRLFEGSRQHDDEDFIASPSVKDRLQEWESRIEKSASVDIDDDESSGSHVRNKQHANDGSAEWKSFLDKKVRAESDAAARQSKSQEEPGDAILASRDAEYTRTKNASKNRVSQDDDSIFAFRETSAMGIANRHQKVGSTTSLGDLSDLSPIHHQDDLSDNEPAPSDAYGPTEEDRGISSFFQRLSSCAAPIVPNGTKAADGSSMQSTHLDFLRSIPQSSAARKASLFVSSSLACGNPDVEEEGSSHSAHSVGSGLEGSRVDGPLTGEKQRSVSVPRSTKMAAPAGRTSSSSVVSEDFGAKTAYLEALAMRAAVAKPKRSGSRRREHLSGSSSVASGATDSSEKWRAFLDRKRAAGSGARDNASRTNSQSEVSRAAEKYAAEKVEEIMMKMAARSKSAPRSSHDHKEIDRMLDTSEEKHGSSGDKTIARKKGSSVKAAEDLAAARVEAMMAALSTNQLDEGEI